MSFARFAAVSRFEDDGHEGSPKRTRAADRERCAHAPKGRDGVRREFHVEPFRLKLDGVCAAPCE